MSSESFIVSVAAAAVVVDLVCDFGSVMVETMSAWACMMDRQRGFNGG